MVSSFSRITWDRVRHRSHCHALTPIKSRGASALRHRRLISIASESLVPSTSLPHLTLLFLSVLIMKSHQGHQKKRRMREMGFSTLLLGASLLLPVSVSASAPPSIYSRPYDSSPFLSPQIPLEDLSSLSGTHEFVRYLWAPAPPHIQY